METNQIIFNENCLDGLKKLKDKSVKTIVADPPYFQGLTHNGKKATFLDLNVSKPFFNELFLQFKRILKDDGEFYFFCDWRGYAFYYPLMEQFLNIRNMIVWDKISGAGNAYAFTHELIVYGSEKPINKKGQNIWRIKAFSSGAKKTNGEKIHPTQKVTELITKIVSESSKEGDLIVDPFSGSGTTAVVCKNLNRNFKGFEISENYHRLSMNRLEAA